MRRYFNWGEDGEVKDNLMIFITYRKSITATILFNGKLNLTYADI